jgi:hypothetical protein
MKRLVALSLALLALALPASASADFGDKYGFAAINDGSGPAQEAAAFPGTEALWAGACDRGAYTGVFGNLTGSGGVGTRPTTVQAPSNTISIHTAVPAPATPEHCIDWGAMGSYKSSPTIWVPGQTPKWRLAPVTQAGAHPDGTTSFAWERGPNMHGGVAPVDGSVDNIVAELPAGFIANPQAVPTCSGEQFGIKPLKCPPESQVGVLRLFIEAVGFGGSNLGFGYDTTYPVFNLEPRPGRAAELGFGYASGERAVTVRLTGKARTNGDFGITAFTGQIPAALVPVAQSITIWGVPWASQNDIWRAKLGLGGDGSLCPVQAGTPNAPHYIPPGGLRDLVSEDCRTQYDPAWGPIMPFVSNETDCNPSPTVKVLTDAFQFPGPYTIEGDPDLTSPDAANWKAYESFSPEVTGCERLGFNPDITLDPTLQGGAANQATDSPSGLDVELSIPQNNDLPFDPPPSGAPQGDVEQYVADARAYFESEQGLATAHLRDTTVTLPEGMSLNPAAADGQASCSMAQIGVTDTNSPVPPKIRFNNQPVSCPDASKVGEVVVETPLLDAADYPTGSVYLAKQGDNPFGSDFAIYIAVESKERGFIAKLAGKVTPDPLTGRISTTFADNPELPFDTFRLRFKAGPRAPLATPTTCGAHTSTNQFTSHAQPGSPVGVNDPFQITSSPAGGCPGTLAQRPLNLGFSAGSTELVAGAHSPFTVRVTRPDGNQELDRIEVTTPEGLAAKLAGVPYCPEAAIAQAIARTASGDGALERANPSCPASSQVGTTTIGAGAGRTPIYVGGKVYLAGPYNGAPVSLAFIVPAVAGPFDLGVQVVRTALNVNPKTAQVTASSDTIPKILRGVPLRIRDVRVDIDRPGFTLNPTDCAEQQVTGRVFGASGAITAVSNRFQIAECARLGFKPNLKLTLFGDTKRGDYQRLKAVVTARPGDANIARAAVTLPHSEFLAQEHIRTVCTRVQFAADACPAAAIYGKATAISPLLDQPLTGPVYLRSSDNLLPDLVAALKGPDNQPIEIELSGRTDSKNEGIRNTFDVVPDAPVTKFTLEMQGGKKSLIVNSTDICRGVHKADVKMDGQNGRKHYFQTKVVNPACGKTKKKGKKAKAHKRPVATRTLASVAGGLF